MADCIDRCRGGFAFWRQKDSGIDEGPWKRLPKKTTNWKAKPKNQSPKVYKLLGLDLLFLIGSSTNNNIF
jgi:hypothetical protein